MVWCAGPVDGTRFARLLVPAGVGALLVLQLVVLYLPSAPGPSLSLPHVDKAVHALVFAAPVLVAGLGRRRWWPRVAVLGLVHAPVSEAIQHLLLQGRSGDPWDLLADVVGVVGAAIGVSLASRRLGRRRL